MLDCSVEGKRDCGHLINPILNEASEMFIIVVIRPLQELLNIDFALIYDLARSDNRS